MAAPPLIAKLRDLHTNAKAGKLSEFDRRQYEKLRAEIFRVALAAQSASSPANPGRGGMRAALMLKVDLTFPERGLESATTVDVSPTGFAALLAFGPGLQVVAKMTLKVPGTEGVIGKARVVNVVKQGALLRVSFVFEDLDATAQDRLHMAMLDHLLLRFPT
jgi:hypothetical protein